MDSLHETGQLCFTCASGDILIENSVDRTSLVHTLSLTFPNILINNRIVFIDVFDVNEAFSVNLFCEGYSSLDSSGTVLISGRSHVHLVVS